MAVATQGAFFYAVRMEVVFNAQELVGKLTELTKVQIPRAANVALNKALFATRTEFKTYSQSIFNNTVPFTQNAVLFDKPQQVGEDLQARVFLRDSAPKGNAPANYLSPQISGGQVYETRFQRRLRARGFLGGSQGEYMIPSARSTKRPTSGEYVRALWGIQGFEDLRLSGNYGRANYKTAGSYVFVPRGLHQLAVSGISPQISQRARMVRQLNNGRIPPAGIYKVKSKSLEQKFLMLDKVPHVRRKFDFQAFAEDSIEEVFTKEFVKMILR